MRALNPIGVAAFVSAAMKVAVLAGLDMSTELQVAILVLVDAGLALFVSSQTVNAQQMQDAGTSKREVQQVACAHDVQLHPVTDGRIVPEAERPR